MCNFLILQKKGVSLDPTAYLKGITLGRVPYARTYGNEDRLKRLFVRGHLSLLQTARFSSFKIEDAIPVSYTHLTLPTKRIV